MTKAGRVGDCVPRYKPVSAGRSKIHRACRSGSRCGYGQYGCPVCKSDGAGVSTVSGSDGRLANGCTCSNACPKDCCNATAGAISTADQVETAVLSMVVASLNVSIAVNCWVPPTTTEAALGVTTNDTDVAAVTVNMAVLFASPTEPV